MSQGIHVCRDCLNEDPANYQLSKQCVAPSRHHPSPKVLVHWYHGRFYQIRPVPLATKLSGLFAMCEFGIQCRGDTCTYAHSKAEQDAWNTKKFGERYHNYTSKLTYVIAPLNPIGPDYKQLRTKNSDPSRSSGAPQYNPPWQRDTTSESLNPPAQEPAGSRLQHQAKKLASLGPQPESHPAAQNLSIRPLNFAKALAVSTLYTYNKPLQIGFNRR